MTPEATVTVQRWRVEIEAAVADGFTFFDWLGAAEGAEGAVSVVVHLYDRRGRRHRLLRTEVSRETPLHTVDDLLAGAGWHEREVTEMFGLTFAGATDTRRLLLPDGAPRFPLRKREVLSARRAPDWPGDHEPNEHGPAARPPSRRRPSAPGVVVADGPVAPEEGPS